MPLHIDRVDMDLDLTGPVASPTPKETPEAQVARALRSAGLREILRPLVLEIVAEELERLGRRMR